MKTRILLSGAAGHMGKVIASSENITVAAGFDINTERYSYFPVYSDISGIEIDADVIIDFSHPAAFEKIYDYAKRTKTPIVFATTGLSAEQIKAISELASHVPVFYSANMSLGVNLMIETVKSIASKVYGKFDIEIIEKHHRRKIDAPSGTALKIADAINEIIPEKMSYVYDRESKRESRSDNEIGICAIRGGTIAGEHTVIFAGEDEILEIKHTAMSRNIFAKGAIEAAAFIKDKGAGLYTMNELLGGER
jgi:4-hydroxy-tetrahydrodipicolinate reductase